MQPLTVVTGILLGTSFAIAAGLAVVSLMYFILADDYPRLAAEFDTLLLNTGLFVLMTAGCALGFIGLLKRARWRWPAQALMWGGLAAVALYYWPA